MLVGLNRSDIERLEIDDGGPWAINSFLGRDCGGQRWTERLAFGIDLRYAMGDNGEGGERLMALSTTITAKSVVSLQEGLYGVTVNMKYADGEMVLIDKDYTENYWKDMAFSVVFFNLKERMKADIAKYKAEQVILNSSVLATIITNLNSTVGV